MADIETKSLSENAYQPLKDGEIYVPLRAHRAWRPRR